MALVHAKFFKENGEKKQGNQTSISCGGITVNFNNEDAGAREYQHLKAKTDSTVKNKKSNVDGSS
jgi:hypothetical protein